MFTKLAIDITFSDIEDFCRESGEGIRVEYKRDFDIKKHIPKTVSAFANTQGGIFIIGAETDKKTNKVIAIDGIPNSGGIEEQIQQSALTGIYPAVIPEVIICGVPANPNNVVVIVRVDESPQAPHAIQNSKKVYIRTGSITQPYDYAEIDRIEYMLKRREDSQTVIRQIRERTEERIESLFCINEPSITVIARPVFPYRPVISTGNIYEFATGEGGLYWQNSSRVAGGWIASRIDNSESFTYWELNEYGIVYHRETLDKIEKYPGGEKECLGFRKFVWTIGRLIKEATSFYKKCGYLGNVEITVKLRRVFREKLLFYKTYFEILNRSIKPDEIEKQQCLDFQVLASTQCFPQRLVDREKFIDTVNELTDPLLWAFNIIVNAEGKRELVERLLLGEGILGGERKREYL